MRTTAQAASSAKHNRIMDLYMRLLDGALIRKAEEAERYNVNERSIQRDIDDLRVFFEERALTDGEQREIIYDHRLRGYRLTRTYKKDLTNGEALAVCKILLESRALQKAELEPILDKLINCCVPNRNRLQVNELLANERHNYIQPQHDKPLISKLWDIGLAVKEQRLLLIEYTKLKEGTTVQRLVQPVGIMFSEFYFYLTAFIQNIDRELVFENKDDLFPTIYRIDRIQGYRILDEHFKVPYTDRFQEGEFRKRVQFMYGGKLQRIKFIYSGPSIEAVLDRLPTAEVIPQPDGSYAVTAEVFGKGVDMWLRSQGNYIKTTNVIL